jgi:hypothetical protein
MASDEGRRLDLDAAIADMLAGSLPSRATVEWVCDKVSGDDWGGGGLRGSDASTRTRDRSAPPPPPPPHHLVLSRHRRRRRCWRRSPTSWQCAAPSLCVRWGGGGIRRAPRTAPCVTPRQIIGDLRGSEACLCEVLAVGGPLPDTSYLFLGAYVGRGKRSVVTATLLLALKVRACPCMHLCACVCVAATLLLALKVCACPCVPA